MLTEIAACARAALVHAQYTLFGRLKKLCLSPFYTHCWLVSMDNNAKQQQQQQQKIYTKKNKLIIMHLIPVNVWLLQSKRELNNKFHFTHDPPIYLYNEINWLFLIIIIIKQITHNTRPHHTHSLRFTRQYQTPNTLNASSEIYSRWEGIWQAIHTHQLHNTDLHREPLIICYNFVNNLMKEKKKIYINSIRKSLRLGTLKWMCTFLHSWIRTRSIACAGA